jgi:hypothetical protein
MEWSDPSTGTIRTFGTTGTFFVLLEEDPDFEVTGKY